VSIRHRGPSTITSRGMAGSEAWGYLEGAYQCPRGSGPDGKGNGAGRGGDGAGRGGMVDEGSDDLGYYNTSPEARAQYIPHSRCGWPRSCACARALAAGAPGGTQDDARP
jgi:hypothetical protein